MDISERLLKVMARYPKRIAPFLHLPVQSGCTATLHRMGRQMCIRDRRKTVRQRETSSAESVRPAAASRKACSKKRATSSTSSGSPLTATPVSYTHLDVYKRQL